MTSACGRLLRVGDVWRSLGEVPRDLGRSAVTVGNFDGVHRGHHHVVGRTREVAADLGVDQVLAVTFDPHPISVLRPEHAPILLCPLGERVERLVGAGATGVLVVPFTRELAAWSPERFVSEIIVATLHARGVVVGASFRFGRRAAGDVALLREMGADHDFVVEGVALDGGPQVWSSTYVRSCLAAGDVEGAEEALGRTFSVRGVVVAGDRRGRELGYPTANVPVRPAEAVPADGVYAGWLTRLDTGEPMPTAVSVGTNPTFAGERARRVEAYVLDREIGDLDLYGVSVEVAFASRIRGMSAFDGVSALRAQMADDVRRTRTVLGLPGGSGSTGGGVA